MAGRNNGSHGMPPGRLTGKSNHIRIAAKTGNILPYPAERCYLVFQPKIYDTIIHIVKIAKGTEPIREGNHNDIPFFGKHGAVICDFLSTSGQIGPSVNPHHYGTCALSGRCIYAQEMAILRLREFIMATHQKTQTE